MNAKKAVMRVCAALAAVALVYLFGHFLYKGLIEQLLIGNDVAAIITLAAIILIVLVAAKAVFHKKRRKRRKSAWYKHLDAYRKLPMSWVPPSIWKRKSIEEEKTEAKRALKTDFSKLDALEFERFVMALLRQMGYGASAAPKRDSKLRGFAVNVLARKGDEVIAIETRSAHEGIVEEKDVIRLLRSKKKFNADRMLVVSASAVSDGAYSAARSKPLDIWDDRKLRKMVKVYFVK
jgi:HJR/Mrr/RecB family endonuclease